MIVRSFTQSLSILICSLTTIVVQVGWPEESLAQKTKHALLIGIDNYKSETIRDLRGCANDVELIKSILIGKFNVSPTNVLTLKNEDATRSAILKAIKTHLIAKAKPGDVVIIHFSGHGSQMKDVSGDEIDGWDETLVPQDSRTNGVFDISDDEINGLLMKLTERTKHVTFILDSCHSGASARAGNTVREIPADQRHPPSQKAFAISSREIGEGDADFRLNGSAYVLISGCLASQLSNESMFHDRRHGALTWFLAQALHAAGDATTYQDLIDDVRRDVTLRFPTQEPQLEGPGSNQVVFGTDTINTQPYVLVDPIGSSGVTLEAGAVYGMRRSANLQVYAPNTTSFDQSSPIATIQIDHVKDFSSEGHVVTGGPIKDRSKALLDITHFDHSAIPVFIDDQATETLREIRPLLASMNRVKFVIEEADARLIVRHRDGEVTLESGDLEVLVPSISISQPNYAAHLVKQVDSMVRWMTILNLQNPRSDLKIEFRIRRKADPPGTPAPHEIASDTPLTFRIVNHDTLPMYIYVLDVSSDGSVWLLYPPDSGEQQALSPGSQLERTRTLYVPEGRNAVVDVLKVIVTQHPIDPSIFPQGAVRSAQPEDTRGKMNPLERFLANAVRGTRAPRPPEAIKSWGTVQKAVKIRRPEVNLTGFSLHFVQSKEAITLQKQFRSGRDLCLQATKTTKEHCYEFKPISEDQTAFEVIRSPAIRGKAQGSVSVGKAFQEAYQIQDQTGAHRVEPNLDIQVPGLDTEQGIEKRSSGDGETHFPEAEEDDEWSLKQIRVFEAWVKLRKRLGSKEGAEAEGLFIAHPDTGYRNHPEIWQDINGYRPVDVAKGYNYYDGNEDPVDPLLRDRILDNPGHGTASGSVIVSPVGCQLPNAPGCVTGVARGAQLIPLRVHRSVSMVNMGYLSRAILDVAQGNIAGEPKLISIAMGGPPTYSLWNAVKTAEDNGVLIVAAAGNYVSSVVWPARFESTIAVAATNIRCQHWSYSSHGDAVDISAPGESVWRATLDTQHEHMNGMGKGTTFATGHTAGAAALWLAWHHNNPRMQDLRRQGLVTKAFRNILQRSSWRPSISLEENPQGTYCTSSSWDFSYGSGILNATALLESPLEVPLALNDTTQSPSDIPLFASLYPRGTERKTIQEDYLALFGSKRVSGLEILNTFETEILYHYTVNKKVQRLIELAVSGQRGSERIERIRQALLEQDLSQRLRTNLTQTVAEEHRP